MRISHAEKLLEQGYSVVEVAPMAGFRDSGSFIRAFKKKTGVTPGQFKSKF
jgi:AraC-like DNA-binding protein